MSTKLDGISEKFIFTRVGLKVPKALSAHYSHRSAPHFTKVDVPEEIMGQELLDVRLARSFPVENSF